MPDAWADAYLKWLHTFYPPPPPDPKNIKHCHEIVASDFYSSGVRYCRVCGKEHSEIQRSHERYRFVT